MREANSFWPWSRLSRLRFVAVNIAGPAYQAVCKESAAAGTDTKPIDLATFHKFRIDSKFIMSGAEMHVADSAHAKSIPRQR
jgi:hypothetical protein